MIKKINAIISLLLTVSLLAHLLTMSYSFATGWFNYAVCINLARATGLFACVHVILALIIIFFTHSGTNISCYGKRNVRTIVQRATALLIIAILHLHLSAFNFIGAGMPLDSSQKAVIILTEILFFGSVLAHLSVSFTNAFISLGLIRSEKTEIIMNKGSMAVCIILALFSCISMTRFVMGWFS